MTRVSAEREEEPDSAGPDSSHDGDQLLTTAQVASRLQISVPLVRKAIREGRLRASLPGGRKHGYRITPRAVEDWLEASTVIPERPA
jgi:excisionase family DNA binding protein